MFLFVSRTFVEFWEVLKQMWTSGPFGLKREQFRSQHKSNYTAEKMKFSIRISSVNVTKSAVSCGFGYIYWRNP